MTRKSMTIQELIDLKPSMDNPIELVCYDSDLSVKNSNAIKVVAVNEKDSAIAYIDYWGAMGMARNADDLLSIYPSFKQPKKRNLEVFYEAISGYGVVYRSENITSLFVGMYGVEIVMDESHYLLIPNGRKLIYDYDTKELLAWDEELMLE